MQGARLLTIDSFLISQKLAQAIDTSYTLGRSDRGRSGGDLENTSPIIEKWVRIPSNPPIEEV